MSDIENLVKYVIENAIDKIKSLIDTEPTLLTDLIPSKSTTIFYFAISEEFEKIIKEDTIIILIELNVKYADDFLINSDLAVELVERGFYKVFKYLLGANVTKISTEVLCCVLKNSKSEEFADYSEILLEHLETFTYPSLRSIINGVDKKSNSPIHYAVRFSEPEIVKKLITLGASLCVKNRYDAMPIHCIEASVLEDILNNCLQVSDQNEHLVSFNFKPLLPVYTEVQAQATSENDAEEDGPQSSEEGIPMNDFPTDTSHQVTIDSSNAEKKLKTDTELIYQMSKLTNLHHLLKHPVVQSFLMIKWYKMQSLIRVRSLFYIIYVFFFLTFIVASGILEHEENSDFIISKAYIFLWGACTFLLFTKQIFLNCIYFVNIYSNIFKSCNIVVHFILLISLLLKINSIYKQLLSVAILFLVTDLFMFLGKFFSFASYVEMFKRVSIKFFKLLFPGCIILLAFALNFSLLFSEIDESIQKKQLGSLERIALYTFKTIVMFTGELDASRIDFTKHEVFGRLQLLMFIFIAILVFSNLLTGLALNDIKNISDGAEIQAYIRKAERIREVETMLLNINKYRKADPTTNVETMEEVTLAMVETMLLNINKKCKALYVTMLGESFEYSCTNKSDATVIITKEGYIHYDNNNKKKCQLFKKIQLNDKSLKELQIVSKNLKTYDRNM